MREDVSDAIDSIAIARSEFQIHHFVVGQHDTSERQYSQCLLELNIKLNNIRRCEIQIKKLRAKLAATTDEDDAELLRLDISELAFSLKGDMREAGVLYSIFKQFPQYTYEELQAAEGKYWELRLHRQATNDQISAKIGVSSGNIDAMRQAGLLPQEQIKELT